jgi:hypothetical protein
MLSTQLLDVLFVPALLLGYETFENAPGTDGGYGQFIFHADYTHSLVGALVISLVAMVVAMVPWGRRNGLIIGAVVFSHWILDLLVHRADMPILPGNAGNLPLLGLGLWQIPWLTAVVELALVLAGGFLYYHAAMRSAVRAERVDAKEGKAATGLRRQALYTALLMAVLLVSSLVADFFGIGG